MRLRIILFFLLLAENAPSQSIRLLYEEKKYKEIIKEYGNRVEVLDAEETYILGAGYFFEGEDEKAVSLFDKSIRKGFNEPKVHFFKAISLRYLDRIPEALAAFDSACHYDNQNQEYLCEKAFTLYYIKQYDEAIVLYEAAGKMPNNYQAPWYMIPHIWFIQGKDEKALKGLYEGLNNISTDNRYYAMSWMEIATIENRIYKNYDKARNAYLKILSENGYDYDALEGLLVIYNKMNNSKAADSCFGILKKAFEENRLQGNKMKYKRAKVAESEWEGKDMYVYRNFIPPAKMIDIMYTGYLMDSSGQEIERIFQTEQTIQLKDNGPKHILCEVSASGKGRSNYGIGWISDDITAGDFIHLVKEVLAGRLKPAASTRFK